MLPLDCPGRVFGDTIAMFSAYVSSASRSFCFRARKRRNIRILAITTTTPAAIGSVMRRMVPAEVRLFTGTSMVMSPGDDPVPEEELPPLLNGKHSLRLACHTQSFGILAQDVFGSCRHVVHEFKIQEHWNRSEYDLHTRSVVNAEHKR